MKSKKIYDFIKMKKITFIIPVVIALAGLIMGLVAGLEVDIEFKGGTILTYGYSGELSMDDVKSAVEAGGFGTVNVTKASAVTSNLETVQISFASNEGLTVDVQSQVTDLLVEKFAANNIEQLNSQDVNPSSGATFFVKCLVAVLFSFLLLLIYIGFRFKKIGGISAGVFSLVALLHDVIIVFCVFIFFRLPIDANFMAVILTILGYSINNTIIIYDRVRENKTLYGKKMDIRELVNTSITQTLRRSIATTVTTAIAVLSICVIAFLFGVESIISFAFPMFMGLIAGAFSSIFLAGPMWAIWQEHKLKKGTKTK